MRISRGALLRRLRGVGRAGAEGGRGETYWWLLGMVKGQRMVDGPYATQMDAQTTARDRFDSGRWKVVPLRTRDSQKAKSILRHQLVTDQGLPIDNAMQNMHKPTEIRSID